MRSLIIGSGVAVFLGVAAGFAFRFDRAPAPPTAVAATVEAAPTTLAADGSLTAEAAPPSVTEAVASPAPALADRVTQAADEHLYRRASRPERVDFSRPTLGEQPAPWEAGRDASVPRQDLEVAYAGPYRGPPADLAPRDRGEEDDAAPPPPPRDDDDR